MNVLPGHGPETLLRDLLVVPAWAGVASLLTGSRPSGTYPVLDADGALVGILDLAALAASPELHDRLAGEVCTPFSTPHRMLSDLVVENGRLVGRRSGPDRGSTSDARLRRAS